MTVKVLGVDTQNYKIEPEHPSLFDFDNTKRVYCGLYKDAETQCRNPNIKCKNCSVYHGFKGDGKI